MTHSSWSRAGRKLSAVVAVALLVGAVLPVGAAASSPTASSPASGRPTVRRLTPPAGATIDRALLATLRNADRQVMVILQLGGAPVATLRTATRNSLTQPEAAAARKPLNAAQTAILPRIAGLGGRVIGTMVDAYDGIQVLAPSKTVTGLAALPGVIAVHPVTTFARENVNSVPYVRGPGGMGRGRDGHRRDDRHHRHRHRLLPRRLRRFGQRRRLQLRRGARHDRPGQGSRRHHGGLPQRQGGRRL